MDQLRCRIKAAAVSNLTDARYFAALGVDYLGFALQPGSQGFVTAEQVEQMQEWIEGPELVAEFSDLPAEEMASLASTLKLHAVQVGPFGKTSEAALITGLPILQELILGSGIDVDMAQRILDANALHTEAFILDFSRSGMDWDSLLEQSEWMAWLETVCADYSIFLDVKASPTQIDDILDSLRPVGLQLRGGDEQAPGLKGFDELDEWFDVLRED